MRTRRLLPTSNCDDPQCVSVVNRPSECWSTFPFKDPPPPASLPLPHPLSICVFLPSCPMEMEKKAKHKMQTNAFNWPKRTHPLVSIQVKVGRFIGCLLNYLRCIEPAFSNPSQPCLRFSSVTIFVGISALFYACIIALVHCCEVSVFDVII